ncbi:threonine--tRNA ligase [Dongia rigui]|uniref:Threonine--tRNA ligase n=1 Tax=Dongia rigui TaxID=940149 RepID=A0ABU5DW19_9PROT|nr:threonine--tRNA ligase [Dongia rigui]MDY0871493.1 threonine--tRNA ligase [Dongia rigui]
MDAFDHRSIGHRLDLFHIQEEGPGMVFWHPKGWALYRLIEDYIRRRMKAAGFNEIKTPQILSRGLWEKSGHWQKFGPNMFALEDGERQFAVKPMSCPGHLQVFNARLRSYRDLPLRYAEFGACHRNEPSGALMGLMRTRAFVQDDAHVLCRMDQIVDEVKRFSQLLRAVYRDFGFANFGVAFSTRPAAREGSEELWDTAERVLQNAARAAGLDFVTQPGEGAFYGPKLEFILEDRLGRRWQCGTIQLDLVLPGKLGAHYIDEAGNRAVPIMIHHAVLGSLERFIGMLLEHCQGRLPLWLAPDQVLIAAVSDQHLGYAEEAAIQLESEGYRVVIDASNETLPKKIVNWRDRGVPILGVVGAREAEKCRISLRTLADDVRADLPLGEAGVWIKRVAARHCAVSAMSS